MGTFQGILNINGIMTSCPRALLPHFQSEVNSYENQWVHKMIVEYFVMLGIKQCVYMWSIATYQNQVFTILNGMSDYYVQIGDFTDRFSSIYNYQWNEWLSMK